MYKKQFVIVYSNIQNTDNFVFKQIVKKLLFDNFKCYVGRRPSGIAIKIESKYFKAKLNEK